MRSTYSSVKADMDGDFASADTDSKPIIHIYAGWLFSGTTLEYTEKQGRQGDSKEYRKLKASWALSSLKLIVNLVM